MKYTKEDLAYFCLAEVRGVEEKCKWELLESVSSPAELFDESCDFSAFLIKKGKSDVYNSIRTALTPEFCKAAMAQYRAQGVQPLPYSHEGYPCALRQTDVPPLCLYAKGRTELLERDLFCVVGSRRTLPNICKHTESLCAELSAHFSVLTGVAEGGDRAAAVGALQGGGCVCVLPCGLQNAEGAFLERVAKEGLLLSPFPSYVETRKYLYHVRNRAMAAMAKGILVVSAGEVSGAGMTGGFGLEMGKPVYAFPYTIGVSSGKGCNALLKKGAFPTENILDILPDFGINWTEEGKKPTLTAEEYLILSLLRENEEMHVGAIERACNLPQGEVFVLLSSLEIKNLIVRSGGNKYRAV